MEATLIDAALTQSIWAGLALALIFYILKKQEKRDEVQAQREEKYQTIIQELSEKLVLIEALHEDIQDIKEMIIP